MLTRGLDRCIGRVDGVHIRIDEMYIIIREILARTPSAPPPSSSGPSRSEMIALSSHHFQTDIREFYFFLCPSIGICVVIC